MKRSTIEAIVSAIWADISDRSLGTDDVDRETIAQMKNAWYEEIHKLLSGALTVEETEEACANMGIDLRCGCCATLFYSGSGVDAGVGHKLNCQTKRREDDLLAYIKHANDLKWVGWGGSKTDAKRIASLYPNDIPGAPGRDGRPTSGEAGLAIIVKILAEQAERDEAEIADLISRRETHLQLIAQLSREAVDGEAKMEIDELKAQRAALVAEVGSLKAERDEARRQLEEQDRERQR